MSVVYLRRGGERGTFVGAVFRRLEVQQKVAGKQILVKSNIVSHEPYPTTTHPETLEACLRLLLPVTKRIFVADGAAADAGDSSSIIKGHPLKQTCDKLGVTITDLLTNGARVIRTLSLELEVASLAFECDFILSLPVLKSHFVCGLTGALKNQLGFLSVAEKRRLHWHRDVDKLIAELNQVVKPHLYIVDAVETMINTNEVRHGGQPKALGYLLAGTDPVSLDIAGLELLKEVEPRLQGKQFAEIPHLRHAVSLRVGEPQYEIIEL